MLTRVIRVCGKRYGFFWQSKQQQEVTSEQPKSKEQFLKELREKREEYENIKLKNQRETQYFDQRVQRELEVNYGMVQ